MADVLAVRYGTRTTRRSDVYLHYDAYGAPDGELAMDYFFWVVRDSGHTTLIDCGFNEASGGRRGRTMLYPPVDALARLNLTPTTLVVTHAHYDHIGNLSAFPHARIVMSRREYDFWTGPMGTKVLFASSAEADDLANLRKAHDEGRVEFIESGTEVDGLQLTEVGGHTPGQLIVTVGDVVIASDALHYYEELDHDMPFTHVADLPAMYTAFDRLRSLRETGHHLVAGHDHDVMRRFPVIADGLAVSVPVNGR